MASVLEKDILIPQPQQPELVIEETSSSNLSLGAIEATRPQLRMCDEEKVCEAEVLDWEGDDDIAKPSNWPLWVRIYNTAVPAIHCFLVTLGTSVVTSAVFLIEIEFHCTQEVALLVLSLFVLGLGLGPLILAPLSEQYGRVIIYQASLLFLLAFTAGAGCAQNITTLLVCRLLAGTLGSAALAVGGGTIADLWIDYSDKAKGTAAILFVFSGYLGPTLGPLIGAYIIFQYENNWRYTMWVMLMIGGPTAILTLFMRETSKYQILHKRARARHQVISQKNSESFKTQLQTSLTRPIIMMFTEPLVGYLSLYTGFAFAMVFSFLTSLPYVFITVYEFNFRQIGLVFVAMMIGCIIGMACFMVINLTLYKKAAIKAGGKCGPEYRLYSAMLGSVLLPISLFWFAWSTDKNVHWMVPTLALVPFGCGLLCIFISATVYLVEVYLAAASASALAANGILRYAFGAAFPLFTLQIYEAWGVHWAGTLFAFASLVLMPVPYVLFVFGKRLRARSSFETATD